MLNQENVEFLRQLLQSLEVAESKLEEAYKKDSIDKFNKVKKFILQVENKISEVIE